MIISGMRIKLFCDKTKMKKGFHKIGKIIITKYNNYYNNTEENFRSIKSSFKIGKWCQSSKLFDSY